MVKVYQFFVAQDETAQDWIDPGYKASRKHLEELKNVRIKILESSVEEIEDTALDPDGRYFPPTPLI